MAGTRKAFAAQKPAVWGETPQEPAARGKAAQKPAAPRKTARKPAREAAGKRLAPYEEKRDFTQTPEPPGKPGGLWVRAQSAGPGGKAPARGLSCSGTGRGGCTTTCGSRSTACW